MTPMVRDKMLDFNELEQRTVHRAVNGMIWLDLNGRVRHANAAALQMLGYRYEALLCKTVFDINAMATPDSAEKKYKRMMTEKGNYSFETMFVTRDKKTFPVDVTAFHIRQQDRDLFCVFFLDVSSRKKMEEKAKEAEDRIQAVFDNHFQLTGLLDTKGRLLMVNNTALDFLELEAHEVSGAFFWETPWFRHSEKLRNDIRRHIKRAAGGDFVRTEFAMPDKHGKRFIFDYSFKPVRDKNGTIRFVVPEARDITEIKQTQSKLKQAYRTLEKLKNRLQDENLYLREELRSNRKLTNLVGQSHAFQNVLFQVEQVAGTHSTVLILGETGTGKELVANAIHDLSGRQDKPLVKLNCAAIPLSLIESELFGHEKGAFTGAHARKIGRFELANQGTIFLDEIGELPLELQTKLLRVLQESEFERIGSSKTLRVDVRIIAATNRDLKSMIQSGTFREDLFYRLHVFPVNIPPLRERKDDIPLLSNFLIRQITKRIGKAVTGISKPAMKKLQDYDWPGNVRELANVLERASVLSRTEILEIGNWFDTEGQESVNYTESMTLDELQRHHIKKVLKKTNGRIRGRYGAARILGLKPTTLESRLKKLQINKYEIVD